MSALKVCTKCGEEKQEEEFSLKLKGGPGRRATCKNCASEVFSTWDSLHRLERTLAQRAQRAKNPEKLAAEKARYYAGHQDLIVSTGAAYYARNAERIKQEVSARTRRPGWLSANRGKRNAHTARRSAAKLQATPAWANAFFIEEAYDLAQRRTKATGFEWQVDHTVPLRSKKVCGLHVEFNLQVIPIKVNQEKGNRYWPQMPEQEMRAA